VFVADTGGHRVVVFDEKGNLLQRIGAKGTAEGFFQAPRDVAANDDFLYVLDSGNSRVQKFKVVRNY
jgi:DNA-binding beta-propeller fold protein YncE